MLSLSLKEMEELELMLDRILCALDNLEKALISGSAERIAAAAEFPEHCQEARWKQAIESLDQRRCREFSPLETPALQRALQLAAEGQRSLRRSAALLVNGVICSRAAWQEIASAGESTYLPSGDMNLPLRSLKLGLKA